MFQPKSPEWLKKQTATIGSSSAAAAVGLSRWQSPTELWLVITGQMPPADLSDNPDVRRGVEEEAFALEYFAELIGEEILPHDQNDFRYNLHLYPWAHALPDGWTRSEEPVDAKCPRSIAKAIAGELDEEYIIQGQHAMAVLGTRVYHFAFFDAMNRRCVHVPLPRDNDCIDILMAAEAEFWSHVKDGTPPSLMSERAGDFSRVYESGKTKAVLSGENVTALVARLKDSKARLTAAEADYEMAKSDIKAMAGDADLIVVEGLLLASNGEQAGRKTFDATAAIKKYPDLDSPDFWKTGKPFRTFCPTFLES